MKVLVTGTDGYIGCVMADVLLAEGHEVTGVDAGFYRAGWLYDGVARIPATLTRDIRDLTADDVAGFEAVVHLAELSNDPLGQLAPDVTFAINHRGSVHLAEVARAAGVPRFVYMSSCSVYGIGASDEPVTEESPVNPLTAYAECKVLVEGDVGAMAGGDFHPTFLRNATAFGASPRMRFDIVLNNLVGVAWTAGEIRMLSDGSPWRPLVHIRDTTRAVLAVLAAPVDAVHGQVLNVGSNEQNYQIREIAQIVADAVPGATTSFGPPNPDHRSYRVSFDKIGGVLPAFECAWDARTGAAELAAVFAAIGLDEGQFNGRPFTRLEQLQHLLDTGQLSRDFRWIRADAAQPASVEPVGAGEP